MSIFKKTFNTGFKYNLSHFGRSSKLAFASSFYFGFDLCDDFMYEVFGKKMIEVIECILRENTSEYQVENCENYLIMANSHFLKEKLDWSSTIKDAWFNTYKSYECCGIIINEQEINIFLTELIEWIYE